MRRVIGLATFIIFMSPHGPEQHQPPPIWDREGIPSKQSSTPKKKPNQDLPPGAKAAYGGEVERQIEELNRRWADAIIRRDATAQDDVLADEYTATGVNGGVVAKAQILMSLRAPPGADANKLESINAEESAVRVYGEVALFSGRVRLSGRCKGRPFSEPVRMTIVYVRRGGRWQPVSSHATRILAD